MWGMTVGAVGLPPVLIIAQIYTQISFVARKVNDIKVYIVFAPVKAAGVCLVEGMLLVINSI